MNAIFALVLDTFREALARKIFWAFFFASSAILFLLIFIMHVDIVEGMVASISLFGTAHPKEQSADHLMRGVQGALSGFLYTFGMGLAIFASAGLISAVFEPGRVELLLSKPVARHTILLGRYLGNLLIVAANLFYLVLGFWVIFGIKIGVWRPELLGASLVTLFVFAVMLAFILLISVIWESGAVAIIATFALVVMGFVLGARSNIERLLSSEFSRGVVRVLYYALPKLADIATMLKHFVEGTPIDDWMPLWSTALFGIAALGTGLWVFSRRDF